MLGRLAAVVLVFSWLPDCKGAGEPGSFEKFLNLTSSPLNREEMCSEANDGKRYWIEGYLQLPKSIQIRKNRTRLEFYAHIDGNGQGKGRSISSIEVTTPGDIEDLMAAATGTKYRGRSTTGQIDADALRIRTTNGVATARDKVKLTVDVVGLPERDFPFASRQLAACEYRFVKAEKL